MIQDDVLCKTQIQACAFSTQQPPFNSVWQGGQAWPTATFSSSKIYQLAVSTKLLQTPIEIAGIQLELWRAPMESVFFLSSQCSVVGDNKFVLSGESCRMALRRRKILYKLNLCLETKKGKERKKHGEKSAELLCAWQAQPLHTPGQSYIRLETEAENLRSCTVTVCNETEVPKVTGSQRASSTPCIFFVLSRMHRTMPLE